MQTLQEKIERVKIAAAKAPVTKPSPTSDPFTTELAQLKRRFDLLPAYSFILNDNEALFKVSMPITDPEFPYEMEHLKLDIRIPREYPKAAPSITVDTAGTDTADPRVHKCRVQASSQFHARSDERQTSSKVH